MASESMPVDPISIRHVRAIEVQSVQIGAMAGYVPPGSLVALWAVKIVIWIIVLIIRRKPHIAEMKSNFMQACFQHV